MWMTASLISWLVFFLSSAAGYGFLYMMVGMAILYRHGYWRFSGTYSDAASSFATVESKLKEFASAGDQTALLILRGINIAKWVAPASLAAAFIFSLVGSL
jgi:hypothetical protein